MFSWYDATLKFFINMMNSWAFDLIFCLLMWKALVLNISIILFLDKLFEAAFLNEILIHNFRKLIHKATIWTIKYITQAKQDHALLYWTHCDVLATNDKPQLSSQFQISLMPGDICCVYSLYPSTCKNDQKDIIKVKSIWNI